MSQIINNTNFIARKNLNKDENGNYLYDKEEMKEKWEIVDTRDSYHTIKSIIGIQAIFLRSKETNQITKGSICINRLRNSIHFTTLKELILQSELGQKCIEIGSTLFTEKGNSWCELIDDQIILMTEGKATSEWGEGTPTRQRIMLTHIGLIKPQSFRIYLNNLKTFLLFEYEDMPEYDKKYIKFNKMDIILK